MSVPKSRRKQSEVQYVVIVQRIYNRLIQFCDEQSHYVTFLSERLCENAAVAYDNCTLFFEMTRGVMRGTNSDKKKACKNAIWSIRQLASELNVYMGWRITQSKTSAEISQMSYDLKRAVDILRGQYNKIVVDKEDRKINK